VTNPHRLEVRIYWEDTDASGLVYHTSYLRFMERGRTEMLRELGLSQRSLLEGAGGAPHFYVVRAMEVDFRRPALMDDLIAIESRVAEIGGASVLIEQKAMRGETLLVGAKVTIACVENGRAKRLSPEARAMFATRLVPPAAVTEN
jgi:acyl-CoA thioester hydrolase